MIKYNCDCKKCMAFYDSDEFQSELAEIDAIVAHHNAERISEENARALADLFDYELGS